VRGCTAVPPPAARSALEGWLALLAVYFANHGHPLLDLSQHAQVGGGRVQ